MVHVADYPQLQALCWNRRQDTTMAERDALRLYNRNWRHVNRKRIGKAELAFIRHLKATYGAAQLDV